MCPNNNSKSKNNDKVVNSSHQTRAVIVLEAVDDDVPETEETFTLTLTSVTGSAVLGDIMTREVVVAASDAPFGSIEMFTVDR